MAKNKQAFEASVKFFEQMHGLTNEDAIKAAERYEANYTKLQRNLAAGKVEKKPAIKPKGYDRYGI